MLSGPRHELSDAIAECPFENKIGDAAPWFRYALVF
jgi:hypothetical protein